MSRVEIGVWDWGRPEWVASYYPSDLPVDWRPAYYANDYACVGLPSSAWMPADVSGWAEETGAHLCFWLGCGVRQLAVPGLVEHLYTLGSRLAGLVFEQVDATTARGLMEALKRAGVAPAQAAEPPLPGIGAPWRAEHPDRPGGVGLYRPRAEDDARKRRSLLEAFAAAPGPVDRCLLVDGPPAVVDECRQLTQLLGL